MEAEISSGPTTFAPDLPTDEARIAARSTLIPEGEQDGGTQMVTMTVEPSYASATP